MTFNQELLNRAAAYVKELERRYEQATDAEERRLYEIKLKNARGVAWCAAAWHLVYHRKPPVEAPDRKERP